MSRMECSVSDGEQPDDEQIIPTPDPDEMRDDLIVTLEDIGRLRTQNDILEKLDTGLSEGMYRKRQAE